MEQTLIPQDGQYEFDMYPQTEHKFLLGLVGIGA